MPVKADREFRLSVLGFRGALFLVAFPVLSVLPAHAGDWSITPRFEVEETYTDNVTLVTVGKMDDFVTQLRPGLTILGTTPRGQVSASYDLTYLYAADLDKDTFQHDLAGAFSYQVLPDFLSLTGQATISEQFLSRVGGISGSRANFTGNRQTVQGYTISPTVTHRIGDWANFSANYALGYFKADRGTQNQPNIPTVTPSFTQSAVATLGSGNNFYRLRWDMSFRFSETDRSQNRGKFRSKTAQGNLELVLDRHFSLVGSGGYEKFEDPLLPIGLPDSAIWDFGARLQPGPKSHVEVRYGKRFGGMTWFADASYDFSPRLSFQVNYSENFQTVQSGLGLLLGNIAIDADGNLVDVTTGLPFNPADAAFDLSDIAFLQKRLTASIVVRKGRTSATLQGFVERRERAVATQSEKGSGATASISRELNRKTSADISFSYQRFDFADQVRRDRFYSGRFSVDYKLTKIVSARLSYIGSFRNSTTALNDINENAVSLSLRASF